MSSAIDNLCDKAGDLFYELCQKVKDMEMEINAKDERIEELEAELEYANKEIARLEGDAQ